MVKNREIKVKNIENEEIIMTMIMTKTIITQIINNNDENENKNW